MQDPDDPSSVDGPPDFTEDNPQYVEEAHPQVGPAHIHTINWTRWCYTSEDYERVFATPETGGDKGTKAPSPVLIGAGKAL